jgi:hypothetical protein
MGMCCIVSKPSGSWHFLGLTHFLPSFRTFPTGQAQPGLQSLGQTGLGSSHVPVQGAHSKYFWPSISQALGHSSMLTQWVPSFTTSPTGQAQPGIQTNGQTGLGSSHVPVQGAQKNFFCPSISQALGHSSLLIQIPSFKTFPKGQAQPGPQVRGQAG